MNHMNFDAKFQEYMSEWVQENAHLYGNNYDRLEEQMPEVYLQWLNTPADWLGGETPGTYFAKYDDVDELVSWMRGYFEKGIPVPDQLLERLTDLGDVSEHALYALMLDESAPKDARLTAITLLSELESQLPMAKYITWIASRETRDERADMAAEALVAMGHAVVEPILSALEGATYDGRETFADVLCNFPGEEAIFALTKSLFETEKHKRALYASLLGKLGDERAVPLLLAAMDDEGINYLDYIELRNALEALGTDAPAEREFDGDPYYESLRSME